MRIYAMFKRYTSCTKSKLKLDFAYGSQPLETFYLLGHFDWKCLEGDNKNKSGELFLALIQSGYLIPTVDGSGRELFLQTIPFTILRGFGFLERKLPKFCNMRALILEGFIIMIHSIYIWEDQSLIFNLKTKDLRCVRNKCLHNI